ncbi:phage portal protein [Escherichia coli]
MAAELAADIRRLWAEWSVSPDVTGQYTRPVLERLLLRTWLRMVKCLRRWSVVRETVWNGRRECHSGLKRWSRILFHGSDESAGLNQGVFLDEWGRPKKDLVYKKYLRSAAGRVMLKEIAAGKMIHLKFTRRLHQTRGSSMLSGVLMRISALKEYEDAELTAARIAAALGLYP